MPGRLKHSRTYSSLTVCDCKSVRRHGLNRLASLKEVQYRETTPQATGVGLLSHINESGDKYADARDDWSTFSDNDKITMPLRSRSKHFAGAATFQLSLLHSLAITGFTYAVPAAISAEPHHFQPFHIRSS